MGQSKISISVVIPAFNEERYIGNTIKSIQQYAPPDTEIILVDNGSTDKTPEIAQSMGARVLVVLDATIAGLRNAGAAESKGDVLVFVDADVCLTKAWGEFCENHVLSDLMSCPEQVTGSRCLPPPDGGYFTDHWFRLLVSYDAPYINSGHLIVARSLFDKVGGFSAQLVTAEDYDFCMKAKTVGARINNAPQLKVYHYGYPSDARGFIKRERWHGKEDFQTWQSFLSSKVGLVAAANLALGLLALLLMLFRGDVRYVLFFGLLMAGVSIFLSLYKFDRARIASLPRTSLIFYLYLCGRSLSLLDRLGDLVKK